MSISTTELDEIAQRLLEMLDFRITSGTITIHFNEGRAQQITGNPTLWKRRADSREPLVKTRI